MMHPAEEPYTEPLYRKVASDRYRDELPFRRFKNQVLK